MTAEELQDQVSKNYILNISELEKYEPEIDIFNDVLSPMNWNCCDRCGALGDSGYDFIWIDYLEEEYDSDLLKALVGEPDYCAICWDCVKELKNKIKE